MIVFIIVKYLLSYFVHFQNVALPNVLRWGTISAMVHSFFRRSAKMSRSTRKHGLTCLEYMVRIVDQTARVAMKPCQDYVKLFSASTGYKSSANQLSMCVYLPISCEVASMCRKLSLRRWNPSSAGTPCVVSKVAERGLQLLELFVASIFELHHLHTVLWGWGEGTATAASVRLFARRTSGFQSFLGKPPMWLTSNREGYNCLGLTFLT